jgi:hypothetical protein
MRGTNATLDTHASAADDVRHPIVGAVMDIVVWLRSLGLGKYEAVFRISVDGVARHDQNWLSENGRKNDG